MAIQKIGNSIFNKILTVNFRKAKKHQMMTECFSLIDQIIAYIENYNKENQKNRSYKSGELDYFLHIGEFTYIFSYLEALVRKYFDSLLPLSEEEKSKIEEESNTKRSRSENLLKASSIILSLRGKTNEQLELQKFITEFPEINSDRKNIQHGCWSINPNGGHILVKHSLPYRKKFENYLHFSNIEEFQSVNRKCKKWIKNFITKMKVEPLSEPSNNIEELYT